MARRHEPKTEVLTASAAPVTKIDIESGITNAKALRQEWQNLAWNYYDTVPEVRFAATFVGNALARVRIVAAERPKKPGNRPKVLTSGPAYDAMNGFVDSTGSSRGLMRDLGLNLFIEGEAYLLSRGEGSWEIASTDEIQISQWGPGNVKVEFRDHPGASWQAVPDTAFVHRIWRPHPRYSRMADSAMRSVVDDCEKLLMLSRAEKAAVRSRFGSAGILFIPSELVPPVQQTQDRNPNKIMSNPLFMDIAEALVAAHNDEADPGNLVPIMIFGPAQFGQAIKHISLDRPLDKLNEKVRDSAIRRLAVAFDLPTEFLMGLQDLSHWTAWTVMDQTFAAHLQPFIELLVDSLTVSYLHPILRRAGLSEEEITKYTVWYDATDLIVRPDQTDAAVQAHDRFVISDATLRRVLNFTEEDAPEEEERTRRVGLKLVEPRMAVKGELPPKETATVVPKDQARQPGRPTGTLKTTGNEADTKGSTQGGQNANPRKTRSARRKRSGPSSGTRPGSLTAAGDDNALAELSFLLGDIDADLIEDIQRGIDSASDETKLQVADDLANRISAAVLEAAEAVAEVTSSEVPGWVRVASAERYGAVRAALIRSIEEYIQIRLADPNALIPSELVREPVRIGGGGGISTSLGDYNGAASGKFIVEQLASLGFGPGGSLWVYSPNLKRPRGSLNAHLQLDGLVFYSPQDENLRVPDEATYRFLKRDFMKPGDHVGCLCITTPWLGPSQDGFELV